MFASRRRWVPSPTPASTSTKSRCGRWSIRQRSCRWNIRQRSCPWNIRQRSCPWSRPPCNEGVPMEADAGPCAYAVLANLMGLAGVVLLAFPAWYVAHYALLSARLAGKRDTLGKGLDTIAENTQKELATLRDAWGMGKFAALVLGTLAAGGSYLLSLVGSFACPGRSEEHTSELQSLMRISYAVFCLKKKKTKLNR